MDHTIPGQDVLSTLNLWKEQERELTTAWKKASGTKQQLIEKYEIWVGSLEIREKFLDKGRTELAKGRVELEKERQEFADEQKSHDKLAKLEHELRQQQAILDQRTLEYEERIKELEAVPTKVQKLCNDSAVKEIVRFNVLGHHYELPMSLVERSDVLRMLVSRRSAGDLDPDGRLRLVYSPQKFQALVEYLLDGHESSFSPPLASDIADYFGIVDHRSNTNSSSNRSNVSFSKEKITFTPHRWDKDIQFCGFCGHGQLRRVCSICHLCQQCDSRNCSCFCRRMSVHMLVQGT